MSHFKIEVHAHKMTSIIKYMQSNGLNWTFANQVAFETFIFYQIKREVNNFCNFISICLYVYALLYWHDIDWQIIVLFEHKKAL